MWLVSMGIDFSESIPCMLRPTLWLGWVDRAAQNGIFCFLGTLIWTFFSFWLLIDLGEVLNFKLTSSSSRSLSSSTSSIDGLMISSFTKWSRQLINSSSLSPAVALGNGSRNFGIDSAVTDSSYSFATRSRSELNVNRLYCS